MESFKQFKDKKGAPADDGKAAAPTGGNPTDGKKKDAKTSGTSQKQAGKKNQDKIIISPPDTPLTPNNQEPASGPGSVSIVFQKEEAGSKTAVMAFGRFNPPTTGHDKLVDKVAATAKEHNGSAHVFASHTEDNDKNPIPQKHKLNYMKKAFGDRAQIHGSSKAEPTFMHAAAKLHKAGHEHLVMVAGSDRVKEYQDRLNKYNGKFNDKGEGYHFKSIKVVSAGERDPNAKGTEGMSGTKMREHARAGNHEEFKKGLPKALHPHATEIENHIKKAAQIDEAVLTIQQRIKRGQQLRRMKAKLKLGKRMSRIRMKNPKQIERTTRKMARASMKWRVAGNRGARYQELSPSNKIQVDKMVDKRVAAIKRIASRLKPRVKAAEVRRLQSIRSGQGAKSIKQFMAGNINAM